MKTITRKWVTDDEFRIIKALLRTHKVTEVAQITGRSYPTVSNINQCENFDEFRHGKTEAVPEPVSYMEQMIALLTSIDQELKGYNARIEARLYEDDLKKKRWF